MPAYNSQTTVTLMLVFVQGSKSDHALRNFCQYQPKLDMRSFRLFWFSKIPYHRCGSQDFIQHGRRDLARYRGTSSVNSSEVGDGIFRLWSSIPSLLMLWLLRSPEPQQAWYWLCGTDTMNYFSVHCFVSLVQAKSNKWYKMWTYLVWSLKQCSMWRVSEHPMEP